MDFADLTVGMLMIHLFTFDPRWLALLPGHAQESTTAPALEG